MITKKPNTDDTEMMQVTFSLPASFWADTIALVGDFNGANITTTFLDQSDTGWQTTLDLPTDHIYHYRFLLDGTQWLRDWNGDGFRTNANGKDESIITT